MGGTSNRRKLVVGVLAGLLLLVGLAVGVFLVLQQQEIRKKAAPDTTLSVLPPTKTVNVGEEVVLTVEMNTGTNTVTGSDIQIEYDAQKLALREFTPLPDLLPVVFVTPKIDNSVGSAKASFSAKPADPAQERRGGIATLRFLAQKPGQATVKFGAQTTAHGIGEATADIVASTNSSIITVLSGAGTTPTPALVGLGGVSAVGGTPTPTKSTGSALGGLPTATPTKVSSGSATVSAQTPVAGVSLPIMVGVLSGITLLILGVVLAL
ncbi:MAG: hypothetical protein A2700_00630 [Candidatus Blackburnbacteria bacterium RIFCSPHIGHO2_01_FULL_44_64]|uniref:Cohesin domain-containing protein n=1 Tax=Candidatus Blackburnbacteria bacterium RIFCSPHIGHO2_02_FULL_44_20 TaxID=1797516 RepID=A0A1G1V602_9BACT|nr:MAG: hypothetical protein A2700_00630 [Candidatus Blackburnbacteria bacterium RIFCSPHIGHO2_01_FULL_44_64]OGY10816.1 MAG: hypothetical protein A3D26_01510 [Candidatus Blackburnbacteria bacterium RIFCSPHIGHO2_02_FULL_44_20]OGY10832.1 MAG: hypothetical protein A3E16_04045 [Candidatus Blackburnbacteria bacterium RIFCSPHIGHO2_12_FULL_44_25]OGY15147.1 MAG: hypothetical protein A3A62_03155 [Candidatus Blackburnbacteria bacterium RIFCSPLOWO2_01_FULL_44_43]